MKYLISKKALLMTVSLVALVFLPSALAQAAGMQVYVPFQFTAGSQVLPAGHYVVEADRKALHTIELRTADARKRVFLYVLATYRPESQCKGMLLFHTYGTVNILRNVWMPGRSWGHQLPDSKIERELAKTAKSNRIATLGFPEVKSIPAE